MRLLASSTRRGAGVEARREAGAALMRDYNAIDMPLWFREAGVPSALLTIDGGGHGDFFGPEITSRVRAFLDSVFYGSGEAPGSETLMHMPRTP